MSHGDNTVSVRIQNSHLIQSWHGEKTHATRHNNTTQRNTQHNNKRLSYMAPPRKENPSNKTLKQRLRRDNQKKEEEAEQAEQQRKWREQKAKQRERSKKKEQAMSMSTPKRPVAGADDYACLDPLQRVALDRELQIFKSTNQSIRETTRESTTKIQEMNREITTKIQEMNKESTAKMTRNAESASKSVRSIIFREGENGPPCAEIYASTLTAPTSEMTASTRASTTTFTPASSTHVYRTERNLFPATPDPSAEIRANRDAPNPFASLNLQKPLCSPKDFSWYQALAPAKTHDRFIFGVIHKLPKFDFTDPPELSVDSCDMSL